MDFQNLGTPQKRHYFTRVCLSVKNIANTALNQHILRVDKHPQRRQVISDSRRWMLLKSLSHRTCYCYLIQKRFHVKY